MENTVCLNEEPVDVVKKIPKNSSAGLPVSVV